MQGRILGEIAHLDGYGVAEQACRPAPRKRVREKQYSRFAIGVVVSGCFEYRGEGGDATAVPGTVIFGNRGEHFSCLHQDGSGNRRQVVTFEEEFLRKIAEECGLDETRFPVTAVPPGNFSAAVFGYMRRLALKSADREESAYRLAAAALQLHQSRAITWRVSWRNQLRVLSVVRHLEESYSEPCSLAALANRARLSPFHFLRTFKRVTGQSPAQYVRTARLRAAANDLLATGYSVARIALAAGFNDISHFNASFRTVFGRSPTQWRTR